MLDIKVTRTTAPKQKPQDESKLGFGHIFTDHMFLMDYTEGEGWHDARIVPYGPLPMDPATTVFHYAQEIFEGMKAYRTADNTIQLFRPDCNAKRFQDSADRLCMPPIPVEDFIQAVDTLVDIDRDWVPHSDGASLYIRPFAFATDVTLTDKFEGGAEGMVTVVTPAARGFIPMMELIDREKELARLQKELAKNEKEITMFQKQLDNPRFVEKAPAALVEETRRKLAAAQDKQTGIQQSIAALS